MASDAIPTPGTSASAVTGTNSGSLYGGALGRTTIQSGTVPTLSHTSSQSRPSSPKRRNRSPTKAVRTLADLGLAQIPVNSVGLDSRDQIPPSLLGLFDSLKRVGRGIGTIPKDLEAEVSAILRPRDPEIEPNWLVPTDAYPVKQQFPLRFEFESLRRVAEMSSECMISSAPEVVWNERVHSRLLEIALTPHREALLHRNVTTVDVYPEFLLPTVGKAEVAASSVLEDLAALSTVENAAAPPSAMLQTKRVDYVIALDDVQVRSEAEQHVRVLVGSGSAVESINHVDHAFLRSRPISVSIETKTPDGGEQHGRVQLGIWGASHIMRLRAAMGDRAEQREPLALPLVLVVGNKWLVFFLVDHGDHMVSSCTRRR